MIWDGGDHFRHNLSEHLPGRRRLKARWVLTQCNEPAVCSRARLLAKVCANVRVGLCCLNTLVVWSAARMPRQAACEVASGRQWQLLWQLPPSGQRGTGPCACLKERASAASMVLSAPLLVPLCPWQKSVNHSLSGCFGGCVPSQFWGTKHSDRASPLAPAVRLPLSRATGLCYAPLRKQLSPPPPARLPLALQRRRRRLWV